MSMQTYDKIAAHIPDAPLCSDCDQPMRIKNAEFSANAVKIIYYCKACNLQLKESSGHPHG